MNDNFSIADVEKAIKSTEKLLSLKLDNNIYEKYTRGYYQSLLTYDKLRLDNRTIETLPYIQKIMIGAKAFCQQPVDYYDIVSSCRCVYYIQLLEFALLMTSKTQYQNKKIRKLKKIKNADEFEALLFELLICARYVQQFSPKYSEFIPESSSGKTPDIKLVIGKEEYYIECKRINRLSDFSTEIRNILKEKLHNSIQKLLGRKSLLFELVLFHHPKEIAKEMFEEAFEVITNETVKTYTNNFFSLKAETLPDYIGDIFLYPSPAFFKNRYRYEYKDESSWQGLLNYIFKPQKILISKEGEGQPVCDSSWYAGMAQDIAINWKFESEDLRNRYKLLRHKRFHEGINQLSAYGNRTILHCWFDKDKSIGDRETELKKFEKSLDPSIDNISLIIFSECDFNISPKGFYDLIENTYSIKRDDYPPQMILDKVFADKLISDKGPWGKGTPLPPIDDIK